MARSDRVLRILIPTLVWLCAGGVAYANFGPAQGSGGGAPTLAQVLAAGANGNGVEITNVGGLDVDSLNFNSAQIYSSAGLALEAAAGTAQITAAGASPIVLKTTNVTRWTIPSGGGLLGPEMADPSAPAADNGILYFRDNGSGKTQLVARFPTGAVQVIATEP